MIKFTDSIQRRSRVNDFFLKTSMESVLHMCLRPQLLYIRMWELEGFGVKGGDCHWKCADVAIFFLLCQISWWHTSGGALCVKRNTLSVKPGRSSWTFQWTTGLLRRQQRALFQEADEKNILSSVTLSSPSRAPHWHPAAVCESQAAWRCFCRSSTSSVPLWFPPQLAIRQY